MRCCGPRFAPLKFLLWGLTPFMAEATGRNLAPTYDFFRIYRSGDVCRLHTDRPACDHSMSLTLAYSDGLAWPFDVMPRGATPATAADDGARSTRFAMAAGDAILYRGVEVPHGRATANPNGWSAHLFLHWVDLDGPYRVRPSTANSRRIRWISHSPESFRARTRRRDDRPRREH